MTGERKLGKGLGALLPRAAKKTPQSGGEQNTGPEAETLSPVEKMSGYALQVPISSLTANRKQPRNRFDQNRLEELAASIREQGVLQPIVVRKKDDGGYEIIAGERRTRASQLAGLEKVPVIFSDVTDSHMLEAALVENLQREDLNPIEVALAYQTLLEDLGLTHEEVAGRMGVSRVSVTNTLRLLGLNEEIKEMVSRGTLGAGHARALLGLRLGEDRASLARRIVTEDLSVRAVEREVKKINKSRKRGGKERPSRKPSTHAVEDYEERLRERFGTKIKITDRGGKGQIAIEYYSNEDFQRIFQVLGIELNS